MRYKSSFHIFPSITSLNLFYTYCLLTLTYLISQQQTNSLMRIYIKPTEIIILKRLTITQSKAVLEQPLNPVASTNNDAVYCPERILKSGRGQTVFFGNWKVGRSSSAGSNTDRNKKIRTLAYLNRKTKGILTELPTNLFSQMSHKIIIAKQVIAGKIIHAIYKISYTYYLHKRWNIQYVEDTTLPRQKGIIIFLCFYNSYIFSKKAPVIFGKGILYFGKGLFRTLKYLELKAYSEPWYIQNARHIQNSIRHLRWKA